ncbi:MAG: BamA/TamA family outer membrane protein [Cytophagales bacterium]|nr:BamA/TamA family outer membrane protein [Cytophagales bacterium]
MRKILFGLVPLLFICNVCSNADNYELAYQNIIVDTNVGVPLSLLENDSIYPIQITKIGDFVQTIDNLLVSKSYYRFLLSHAVRKYKKDGNIESLNSSCKMIKGKQNKTILSKLCNKKIIFSYQKTKNKIKQIKDYFQSIGFLDVKVLAHIVKNKKNKVVSLEYFVKTGSQYTIEHIHFLCDSRKLSRLVKKNYISSIKPGHNINYEELNEERNLLLNFLCSKDYFHIAAGQLKFNLCKNQIKKTVDIYVQILVPHDIEPQKIKYNTININYVYKNKNYISSINANKFIKPRIVQKAVNIRPGNYYSPQQEERFYNYFHNSDIFNFVSFQKRRINNTLDASLILSLKPKMSFSVYCNFLFSSEDIRNSIEASLKVMNIFHTLDVLDIKASASFTIYNFYQGFVFKDLVCNCNPLLYYPFSHIFNSTNILTTIGCVFNVCRSESTKKQQTQYLVQLLHWQYQIFISNIFSIFTKLVPFEVIMYKKTKERFINPNVNFIFNVNNRKSFLFNLNLETGLNRHKVINPYFKFLFDVVPTIHISNSMYIALRLKYGAILRTDPKISENILFKIGGPNTLRGWEEDTVGPGSAIIFPKKNRVGDMLILLNLETVHKINKHCSVNWFFLDVGNIFNLICLYDPSYEDDGDKVFCWRDFWRKFYIDAGCGIRFNWNFFVVRLDIAFIVFDPTKAPNLGERYFPLTPNFSFVLGLPFDNVI